MTQPPSYPPAGRRRAAPEPEPKPEVPPVPPSVPPPATRDGRQRPVRQSVMPDSGAPKPAQAPRQQSAPPAYAPQRHTRPQPAPQLDAPRAPQQAAPSPQPSRPRKKRKRPFRAVALFIALLLIGWPTFLLFWVNSHLDRVDALVPTQKTAGTTYLLAGSDAREPGEPGDIEGERADSIVLVRKAPGGQTSLISLPRDLLVQIPGHGENKINAAFSFGGPQLLVETVQNLTGLQIDHYVQINMQGFGPLVNAVGGVNLCMDMDVADEFSGLNWQSGCHDVDGTVALAFARMRYSDPRGDLGRAERQRQVISAVTGKAISGSTIFNPAQQWKLAQSGTETVTVDERTGLIGLGRLLLAFRASSKSGLTGTPPLASVSEMTNVGAVVLLDENSAPAFFEKLRDGKLSPADFSTPF